MRKNKKIFYAEANYSNDEIKAVNKVLRNQKHTLVNGINTKKLENKVKEIFRMKYALMTNSGSSANLLGLASLNFRKGSEIITPALTFSTTVAPIVQCNLIPHFVDIDLETLQIDTKLIEKAINKKTVAIMVPNLIGNIADWKNLRSIANKHKLKLIEDSADTIGYEYKLKKYLNADICTTSFYASHIVTGAGIGGMVCFNNKTDYKQALSLRSWGRRSSLFNESEYYKNRFNVQISGISYDNKYIFDDLGFNFLSSEVSAAFALTQIKKLKKNIKKRQKNFNRLEKMLSEFKDIKTFKNTKGYQSAWLAFPMMLNNKYSLSRTKLQKKLEKSNIQTRTIFTGNITKQPVSKKFRWTKSGSLKNSNKIMTSGILIGCHELINNNDIDYLREKLIEFFK